MIGRPPKRTFLCGEGSAKSHNELPESVELICAMREVAVIAGGNEEHSDRVQADAQKDGKPGHPCPKEEKGGEMDQGKGNCAYPVNTLVLRFFHRICLYVSYHSSRFNLGKVGPCFEPRQG